MRLLPATLLVGAATAAVPAQQVLNQQVMNGQPQEEPAVKEKGFAGALHNFQEQLETLSDEARKLWDEVSNYVPEAMDLSLIHI